MQDVRVVRATHKTKDRQSTVLYVTPDPWTAKRMAGRLQRAHPAWDMQIDTSYIMPESTTHLGGGGWTRSPVPDQEMRSAKVYYPVGCVHHLPHAPMLMRGRHVTNQPLRDAAQERYQRAGLQTGAHHLFMTAMFGLLPPPVSVYCAVMDTASHSPAHLLFTNLTDMDGAANQRDVQMYLLRTMRSIVTCASDAECSRVVIHARMPEEVVRLLTAYVRKSKRGPGNVRLEVHTAPLLGDSLGAPEVHCFDRPKRTLEHSPSGVLNVYDQPPGLFVGSPSVPYEPPVPMSVFDVCNPNINPRVTYRIV